jgi:hypothetical protein
MKPVEAGDQAMNSNQPAVAHKPKNQTIETQNSQSSRVMNCQSRVPPRFGAVARQVNYAATNSIGRTMPPV